MLGTFKYFIREPAADGVVKFGEEAVQLGIERVTTRPLAEVSMTKLERLATIGWMSTAPLRAALRGRTAEKAASLAAAAAGAAGEEKGVGVTPPATH